MRKKISWVRTTLGRSASCLAAGVLLSLLWASMPSRIAAAGKKPQKASARTAAKKRAAPARKVAAKPAPPPIPATLDGIVRAYRESPTPALRAALHQFAQTHSKEESGALALFALANLDLDNNRPAEALPNFLTARRRLPSLADSADYGAGRALVQLNRKVEALPLLDTVVAHQPVSPYRVWALILAANCRTDTGAAAEAIERLQPEAGDLPQPQGTLALARALDAAGKSSAAIPLALKVYSQWPRSPEAVTAEQILRAAGAPIPAPALLDRVEKLMQNGAPTQAAAELRQAIPQLPAEHRDLARVRLGAARFFAREHLGAWEYLNSLAVASGEADAERLYYRLSAARRLEKWNDVEEVLRLLESKYPQSRWRLEALVGAANRYLVGNQPDAFLPLYKACYTAFPNDPQASFCHWRTAWVHYSRRDPNAVFLLADHLNKYPGSPDAAGALYFLGRLKEPSEPGMARAFYEAINRHFANYYYAVLARERMRQPALREAVIPPAASAQIAAWKLPSPQPPDFEPDTVAAQRMKRARLLSKAGLAEMAELELRFGARTDGRPGPLAVEAARIASARGAVGQGIRNIKAMAPAYLTWDLSTAPQSFWKLAFPLPFRASLERHAERNSLDPYLVAALIRQESEFEPRALSRAKAMGLTQIMPSTGRELSRRLGIPYPSTAVLYQPETNLQLGTFFLKRIADSLDGVWEATLAAYNAGPSRARLWLGWSEFREPAEFVEAIPFHETRNYVQSVLRNADIYRRLYANPTAAIPSNLGQLSERPDSPQAGSKATGTQ
ncbi:MAG: lytic transglycosylase domain-containing protein [Bryobacterales bacterium]|nr:lytic transglycosylase domain-containing protein [Bryobacterales bacterium]